MNQEYLGTARRPSKGLHPKFWKGGTIMAKHSTPTLLEAVKSADRFESLIVALYSDQSFPMELRLEFFRLAGLMMHFQRLIVRYLA
jgi:hypothetical protein